MYAKRPDLHTEGRKNEQLYAKWAVLHTERRKTKRNIIEQKYKIMKIEKNKVVAVAYCLTVEIGAHV